MGLIENILLSQTEKRRTRVLNAARAFTNTLNQSLEVVAKLEALINAPSVIFDPSKHLKVTTSELDNFIGGKKIMVVFDADTQFPIYARLIEVEK